MRGIINCAVYSNGHRTENIELKDIGRVLSKEGQFVWVGLYEPDEELMNELRKEFALHELAIEDAHRAHQRPKIEAYNDTYFVVLRTAQMNEEQAEINFGETHFFRDAGQIARDCGERLSRQFDEFLSLLDAAEDEVDAASSRGLALAIQGHTRHRGWSLRCAYSDFVSSGSRSARRTWH